ncbi:MAG TPA: hypothetical protein VHP33_27535 [Polyangiaceae bacterium]|nr:hypothetical protein [Polyangiaceae bacterium]
MTLLHPEIRQVIDSPTVEVALERASAATASAVWTEKAWLTVAAAANSAAIRDSRWLALCIFAHERRLADVAVIDALMKRAQLLALYGADEHDRFRAPTVFFDGVRRFIGGDSSQTSLETFQRAMDVVFHADRKSTEWADARIQFIRGRRLRDIGRALRSVAEAGIVIPTDLAEWLVWAEVREVDGKVLTS